MDENIILTNDHDYQKIQSELNAGKKPSKTLRYMMQALENYRQSKKFGWSRPWNKYDVVNFQSFRLNDSDVQLRRSALDVIAAQWPEMPERAQRFIDELLNGEAAPLGFVFFQEFNDDGNLFEGAVLSYGRINKDNRRYRDRLDLILESPVADGYSVGLSRIRIYVDPFNEQDKKPLWQGVIDNPVNPLAHRLFNRLADISWAWKEDSSRIWRHWITEYIDYFGPRQWPVQASYFYVPGNPGARIASVAE